MYNKYFQQIFYSIDKTKFQLKNWGLIFVETKISQSVLQLNATNILNVQN